jgi:hypothetical protein
MKGSIMAVFRDNKPATSAPTAAPASAPAPAPVKPEEKAVTTTTPADMMFSFSETDVPGRVTATDVTADPEYTALKEKLLAHWKLVQEKKVGPRHGIAFPSRNVSRHVAYLRKAANEYNEAIPAGATTPQLGVAIRTKDVDKTSNTGTIEFRSKLRKQYDK